MIAQQLARDRRGAVTMMALFVSAVGIGMVATVAATSDTVAHRESLQDASDAATYSGATTMADGLNLTSLVNMTSSSLSSIVTSIESLLLLDAAGKLASLAMAPETEGDSLGAMGPLGGVLGIAMGFQSLVVQPAKTMIQAGHAAQVALRRNAPEVGMHLGGIAANTALGGATVSGWPTLPRLPMLDAKPEELCSRGLGFAVSQAIPRFRQDYLMDGGGEWMYVVEPTIQAGRTFVEQAAKTLCGQIGVRGALQVIDPTAMRGSEPFQVRFQVTGPPAPERALDLVRVAHFARRHTGTIDAAADTAKQALLGATALTQAETYFEGSEDHDDYLFHMGWRARLRRLWPAAASLAR